MKRRHLFATPYRMEEEINISPLIDIVFILLIFFMVSTVFRDHESVEIRKPDARSGEVVPEEAFYISVSRAGEISIAGKMIALGSIGPALQRLSPGSSQPIIVEADKAVTAELLVSVIDQVRLTGNTSVHVATTSSD
jgi:biopolymer transport protein ExbD